MANRIVHEGCPPKGRLRQLLDGTLPADAAGPVEDHVEGCAACQAALAGFTSADPYRGTYTPSSSLTYPPGQAFLDDVWERLAAEGVLSGPQYVLPSVPGYEVVREIGHGGMGVVYLARDERLGRPVALKLLHASHAEARDRFEREARSIARVRHPNIVQVYEVGEAAGRPFLALEFVDGQTLAERFRDCAQPPRAAAELTERLARAVHAAHQSGIVHRDLKPTNILIAADGTPKVTDFGLAKLLDDGADPVTHTGQLLGTPGYVPPEQLAPVGRDGTVGPMTDVYALGAVLYELLTGSPPFQVGRPLETLLHVMYREPVPPTKLAPAIPRDLETVCLTCLSKDPGRRYPSAAALADDLARFLAGKPVRARPIGPLSRALRWSRRNPAYAALIAGTAFGLLAAIAGLAWLWRQSEHTARVEAAARHDVQHRAADLAIDRALTLCEQKEPLRGLWELADAAGTLPPDATDLDRAIRVNMDVWQHYVAPRRHSLAHPAGVPALAFSRDGRLLLTACDDGFGRLWDLPTGHRVGPDFAQPGGVTAVAFAPDGNRALTAGNEGLARQWEVPSGQPVETEFRHGAAITVVAYSPNGRSALTAGADGRVRIWDTTSGQPVGEEIRHNGAITAATFSPDGKTVLTGSVDGTARLWDAASGQPASKEISHRKPVKAAAFALDGRSFITGSDAGFAGTWPPEGPQVSNVMKALNTPASGMAFDPHGRYLAVVGGLSDSELSGTTTLLPGKSGQYLMRVLPFIERADTLAVSQDGRCLLAAGGRRYAVLWIEPHEQMLPIRLEHATGVRYVAISPAGNLAATVTQPSGGAGSVVHIWSLPASQDGGRVLPHAEVRFLAVGPSGKVVTAARRSARVWDESTGQPLAPEWKFAGRLAAVSWPGGEGHCWLVDGDRVTQVDAGTGKATGVTLALPSEVADLTTSPDGRRLAVRDVNSVVRVYRTDSPAPQRVFEVEDAGPAMAFSPDGGRLVVANAAGELRFFEADSGRLVVGPVRTRGAVTVIRFRPDGRRVAVAEGGNAVSIRDAESGQVIGLPMLYPDDVVGLEWSPDGATLAGVRGHGSVRLWDAATGKPIGPIMLRRRAPAVAFGADSRRLYIADGSGEVRSWRVPTPITVPLTEIPAWMQSVTGTEGTR